MAIRGVLFDMDGVVVHQRLDFPAIKREIFGDTEGFILERMDGLPAPERRRAEAILERHETAAAQTAEPMDGILPFLVWMEARHLRRGLVTRNSRKSVELVLARLGLNFDAVVTREDAPPKPAPPATPSCAKAFWMASPCRASWLTARNRWAAKYRSAICPAMNWRARSDRPPGPAGSSKAFEPSSRRYSVG